MKRFYSVICAALLVLPGLADAQDRDSLLRLIEITAPAGAAGVDTSGANDTPWGTQPPFGGITGNLVYVDDGLGGREACTPDAIANGPDIAGNIAVVARGTCNFSLKAYNVQAVGAIAVIIHNHDATPTDLPTTIYTMSGGDSAAAVTITAAFAHREWRDRVTPFLESGDTVTGTIHPVCIGGPCGVAIEPGPITESTVHVARPNPFSESTEFGVQLLRTQDVTVEVFNTLGQRVALLHDGPLAAGQTVHTFTLEASSLPSGVYLYRVTGEDFVQTNNVVLAR
jgi:hypothetical protein